MPDGATHHHLWKMGWVFSFPLSLCLVIVRPEIGLGSLCGYALGRYLDPDADIAGLTSSEGRAINELKIFGYVWVSYWTLYGIAFRRHHRSIHTHFPVYSTAIRVVFLLWWLPILYWQNVIQYDEWQLWGFLGFWFGLSFADTIHSVADWFVSDPEISNSGLMKKYKINDINKKSKAGRRRKVR